jgi:hypothetical protein
MNRDQNKNSVEDIMRSTEGMRRAVPDASLFNRIEARLAERYPVVKVIPLRTVSLAAASLLLLVLANLYMVKHTSNAPSGNDSIQTLVNYYGFTDNGYGI